MSCRAGEVLGPAGEREKDRVRKKRDSSLVRHTCGAVGSWSEAGKLLRKALDLGLVLKRCFPILPDRLVYKRQVVALALLLPVRVAIGLL